MIGFTERFNESLLRLADAAGFQHVQYVRVRGKRVYGVSRVNVGSYATPEFAALPAERALKRFTWLRARFNSIELAMQSGRRPFLWGCVACA